MKAVIQLMDGTNSTMFYYGEHEDGHGSFTYSLEDAKIFPNEYEATDIINAQKLKKLFCAPCWKNAKVQLVKLTII